MDIAMSLQQQHQQQQQQQQHHINQLLSTAAAGTGIVGDVDALLTPIQMDGRLLRTESKPERNLWREEEMLQMLNLMMQVNAIEMLNDKTVKSEKVFRNIEALMHECGFRKKSYMQIWTKWKFLKSTYMTSRRAGVVPKVIPYSIYQMLHKVLSSSPNVPNGAGTGTGGSSLDGEASDSNRLVIASVESAASLSNGAAKALHKGGPGHGPGPADLMKEPDDDNGFGMAHPIFGFRLGLVKQEPIDASYENSTNNGTNSEQDPLDDTNANSSCSSPGANHRFLPEIKQEIEEPETDSPPHRLHDEPEEARESQSQSPARPMFLSGTKEAPVPAPAPAPAPLPPLRIAQFAKAPPINGHLSPRECSPPALSLPMSMSMSMCLHPARTPPPRPQVHKHYTRQSQSQGQGQGQAHPMDAGGQSFVRPVFMSKSVQRQQLGNVITTTTTSTPIRLPKDITIHHTRSSNASASANANAPPMSRLKPVPMRKMTNYQAQQIETVMPDANSHIMLQQQKQQRDFGMHHPSEELPSTSQQAAAASAMATTPRKRKRRLQLPQAVPIPTKLSRSYGQAKPSPHSHMEHERGPCLSDGEEENDGGDEDDNSPPTKPPFKKGKQQQKKGPKAKRDDAGFEAALRDLGRSLRSIQRQLMGDFFEKQMELAREEHEFQSKQDRLLMEAFEEQTQLIMRSAKKLLGIDMTGLSKCEGDEKAEGKPEAEVKPEEAKGGSEGDQDQEGEADPKDGPAKESDMKSDIPVAFPKAPSLQFEETTESEEGEEFKGSGGRDGAGPVETPLNDPSELVSSELVEGNEQL